EGEREPTKETPRDVPVTRAKAERGDAESAIAKEARKGYDLLMLGVAEALQPDGALNDDVARIATGFEGPLGLVIGRGAHLERGDSRFRILVPVSGNNVSRRAAEVAVMLARAQDVAVTFLYVSGTQQRGGGLSMLHPHEQAALKELVSWAE